MEFLQKYRFLIPVAIGVIFVLLRFWNLTSTCLWFDEIFSVQAAAYDWKTLFWFVAQDLIHPPLFYVLFKLWILIGGESLFWLRLFGVFAAVISLVPFTLLCRELKLNFSTFLTAFLFFTVNGSLIKYAQEVRMYSLFLLVALFSMWLFVRYFNLGKSLWVLTFVNILLVYTHYFGWLLVVSQILTILIFQNIKIRQMMIMLGLTILSFVPWILVLLEATKINADVGQNLGWISKPNWEAVWQFILDLVEPFFYQQNTAEPPSVYLVTVPLLLVLVTAFVFYFINWSKTDDAEKQSVFLLSILTTAPVAMALIASWILPYSVWGTRHLIIIFIPLYILTAIIMTRIQVLPVKIILISLILALTGAAFIFQINRPPAKFILCAFQELAADLPANSEQTKIFVFEDDVAYHVWFALRHANKNFQVVKVNDLAGINEDKAYFLPRGFDEVQRTDPNGFEGDHYWIAFRDRGWNRSRAPLRNIPIGNHRFGEPKLLEVQGLTVFLVEVWKEH